MGRCCDPACSNSSTDEKKHRWLSFPSDPELKSKWISAINVPDWQPCKSAVLCEAHFSEDAWDPEYTFHLKNNSVPSIFCRCPPAPAEFRKRKAALLDHNWCSSTPKRPNIHSSGRRNIFSGKENAPNTTGRPKKNVRFHLESCPFNPSNKQVAVSHNDLQSVPQSSLHSNLLLVRTLPENAVLASSTLQTPPNCVPVNLKSSDMGSFISKAPEPKKSFAVATATKLSCSNETPILCTPSGTVQQLLLDDLSGKSGEKGVTCSKDSELLLKDKYLNLEKLAAKLTKQVNNARREEELYRTRFRRLQMKFENVTNKLHTKFGEDQLNALALGTGRGRKWSLKTLKLGYKLHFACGSTGYSLISELQMPLPSIRTLNLHIQHLKFHPGVLNQVFPLMGVKVEAMHPQQKECVLAFDEMSITPKIEFDPNLGTQIGKCTLPCQVAKFKPEYKIKHGLTNKNKVHEKIQEIQLQSLNENAQKAMAFMLGSSNHGRWKQLVAYHLTGKSVSGKATLDVVNTIIKKAFEIGLFVRVVTCDMGNGAFWNEVGVKGGRGEMVNSIPHPCSPQELLFFTPDDVHVFKNIFVMFATHNLVILPQDIVSRFHLPTSQADFRDVVFLQTMQKDMRWRFAPKLNSSDLLGGHFRKMDVWNALSVINPQTAAALNFLSLMYKRPSCATTAWFIDLVYRWFKLMTSRTPLWALSKTRPAAYEEAKDTLKLTSYLFENLHYGHVNMEWKPSQTGVKIATKTVLDLAKIYLEDRGDLMFFTGRLTQDMVENIFSVARLFRKYPTPRQWKDRIRKCVVSRFMKKIPGSSYQLDDREDLLFCSDLGGNDDPSAVNTAPQEPDTSDSPTPTIGKNIPDSYIPLLQDEKFVFYKICGYIIFKLFNEKPHIKHCENCHEAVHHKGPVPHSHALFTQKCNYTEDNLVTVSNTVFELLLKTEEDLMREKKKFKLEEEAGMANYVNKVLTKQNSLLPQCHDVQNGIVHRFILMRLRLGLDDIFEEANLVLTSQFASKTMGAAYLAQLKK